MQLLTIHFIGFRDEEQHWEQTFRKRVWNCHLATWRDLAHWWMGIFGIWYSFFSIYFILFFTKWFSIATPVQGQVLGGRWKPLHYFLSNSLFRDVIATCGTDAKCYVKNDGVVAFTGIVTFDAVNLSSGKVTNVLVQKVALAAGAGTINWFCLKYYSIPFISIHFSSFFHTILLVY